MGETSAAADDYDEFGLLTETADELGLSAGAVLPTRRVATEVASSRTVSAIEWGGDPRPSLVFLHGGGQNAHTWDSVLMLLSRPALAIDLPGHGHSDWRSDRDYSARTNAGTVATVIEARATAPVIVIGMSLGGLTAIALAAARPELVQAMLVIDITPGSPARLAEMRSEQRGAVALLDGPKTFDSFDAMAQAAVTASPRRPADAVRRGVRHNSRRLPDGRWAWRYDGVDVPKNPADRDDYRLGWADVQSSTAPTALVIGGESGFVTEDDIAEMHRRKPELQVEVVPESGHSVQSDQPLLLVGLVAAFIDEHSR